MKMLQERSASGDAYAPSWFCSTFFFSKLTNEQADGRREYTYKNVMRWTKRAQIDIFAKEFVFVPVHVNKIHWVMGVVNIGLKQVCYYDSMSASAGQIAFFGETMLRWVKDEHQNKKGAPLPDENKWKVVHPEHVPQQKNGFDCGVFMVTVAEYLSPG
jgi:sentrin-specific protease 1